MYLDYFSLAALAETLRSALLGARLQRILAVDEWDIALELYIRKRRHHLFLSADNHQPRILLMSDSLRRGLTQPQPLVQYLRRHVLGARLQAIEQPPWERILHFRFQTSESEFTIIAEPMSRRANVLLVQDGIIRECLRRVGPAQNRYRRSLPQQKYQPPPPQNQKRPPWPICKTDLTVVCSSAGQRPIVRALSSYLLAMSPLLAREICYRANIKTDTPATEVDTAAIHGVLAELVAPLLANNWQVGVARDSVDEKFLAFSVYPLKQYGVWEKCSDINEAMVLYYDAPIGLAVYDTAKEPIHTAIRTAQRNLARRRASLERGLRDESELRRLQHSGELILAYQNAIAPGQCQLTAHYDAEAPPLTIELDPTKNALENAQSYFRQYQKAKRALNAAPARLTKLAREETLLAQLASDLLLAENWPEIDEVKEALLSAGYLREPKKQQRQRSNSGPRRFVCSGYIVWLGRNMRQNAIILRRHSRPNDLWLHARGTPGAHVIIRDDGRAIPETLTQKVASLAAYYSARRGDVTVPVDITERRNVRPIKGGRPGMVRYSNERTLLVNPQDESILDDPIQS